MAPRTAFVLALLLSSSVFAEGIDETAAGKAARDRIHGATTLLIVPDGSLFTYGGSRLRRFDRKSLKFAVLHQEPRDNLYRMALDGRGERLLAAYEKSPQLRLVTRGQKTTRPVANPVSRDLGEHVDEVAFALGGEAALVFTQQPSPLMIDRVYRVGLAPGSVPEKLIESVSMRVFQSPRGAIYLGGSYKRVGSPAVDQCQPRTCIPNRFIVYDFTTATPSQRTMPLSFPGGKMRAVPRAEGGLETDRAVLTTEAHYGQQPGLVVFRFGEQGYEYRDLPERPEVSRISPDGKDIVFLSRQGVWLKIWRCRLPPESFDCSRTEFDAGQPIVIQPNRRHAHIEKEGVPRSDKPFIAREARAGNFGFRAADGSMWIYFGDDLVLASPQGELRRVNMRRLLGQHEWGGAIYAAHPEELYVGVEVGGSRDFVRVRFAELEKAAVRFRPTDPWVRVSQP